MATNKVPQPNNCPYCYVLYHQCDLKMAPFHHHLELSGWTETQVVGVFYAIEWLLVIICIATK